MNGTTYRTLLTEALLKPTENDKQQVLILVGPSKGLGARGYLLCVNSDGEAVRAFNKTDVRKMLRKMDKVEAESGEKV